MPDPNPPQANLLVQGQTLKPLPTQPNLFVVVVLTAVVAILLYDRFAVHPHGYPAPTPAAPVDESFVALGKQVEPKVAPAYAEAWVAFASALDGSQTLSASLKAFDAKWQSSRESLTAAIQAKLGTIVPAGTADAAVTPAQRAALSAAARGVAQGLNKGTPFPFVIPLSLPRVADPPPADPVIAGDLGRTQAKLASLSTEQPEPTEPMPPPEGPSLPCDGRAMPPEPSTPPPQPEWRPWGSNPAVEVYGVEAGGVFRFTHWRWRDAWTNPTSSPN